MDLLLGLIMMYQEWGKLDIPAFLGPRYQRLQIFYSSPEYYTQQKHGRWQKWQQQQQQQHRDKQQQRDKEQSEQQPPQQSPQGRKSFWQTKTDDFFPYSTSANSFWTGYFTSRTLFKRMERVASSFLLAARQIDAMSHLSGSSSSSSGATDSISNHQDDHNNDDDENNPESNTVLNPEMTLAAPRNIIRDTRIARHVADDDNDDDDDCGCHHDHHHHDNDALWPLEDALGIAQHHDAISGTAKQHVDDDYRFRLHHGLERAARQVGQLLQQQLSTAGLLPSTLTTMKLVYCPLWQNETDCAVSEQGTENSSTSVYTVVYNSRAQPYSTVIRLPVASQSWYQVQDTSNSNVTQIVASVAVAPLGSSSTKDNKHVVLWETGMIPPLSTRVFRVTKTSGPDVPDHANVEAMTTTTTRLKAPLSPPLAPPQLLRDSRKHTSTLSSSSSTTQFANGTEMVSNGLVTVGFEKRTGKMQWIVSGGVNVTLEQTWGYYTSFDRAFDYRSDVPSANPYQNSGTYIFRPSTATQTIRALTPRSATFVNTNVGTEVHVQFRQPWIHQVTRIFSGQPHVEIEYTIGPIPIDDGRGKEIVTRYATPNIASHGTFYTDSNGRQFMKRRRNYRPSWNLNVYEPVAGNFYPVNAAMYLQDAHASMAVVVDRSQGGTSLQDGELELMVQRRILVDDGVGEPLNETCGGVTPYPPYGDATRVGDGVVVRGVHRLLVGKGPVGASLARSVMDAAFAEPLVLVGSAPAIMADNEKAEVNILSTPKQQQQQQQTLSSSSSSAVLTRALPDNVMLVTFLRLADRHDPPTYLLRLGHQYGVGEDPVLSLPVQVNVAQLFANYTMDSIVEMTLSGNQPWSEYMKRRLSWSTSEEEEDSNQVHWHEISADGSTITLKPLEI